MKYCSDNHANWRGLVILNVSFIAITSSVVPSHTGSTLISMSCANKPIVYNNKTSKIFIFSYVSYVYFFNLRSYEIPNLFRLFYTHNRYLDCFYSFYNNNQYYHLIVLQQIFLPLLNTMN